MPVAHHRHQHSPSFLASLGNMFHTRPPQTSASVVPASQTCDGNFNYECFESNLAQRLTLLLPAEGTEFVSLACLRQAMVVLLATESDLRALLPETKSSLCLAQRRLISDFFDKTVKFLDICNDIREAIAEVGRWEGLLALVLDSLSGNLIEAKLKRVGKILVGLKFAIDSEKEDDPCPVQMQRRSLRWSSVHLTESHEPQRWRSWPGSATTVSNPTKQLQATASTLLAPKYPDDDTEEVVAASVYALHVLSVFFLSTVMAAFPCQCRNSIVNLIHPRHFLWAPPFISLHDKALEEMRRRGKKSTNGILWELHQISSYVRQLLELIDTALLFKSFPLPEIQQEEIRSTVKQLSQYIEELQRDLGPLDDQVCEFYRRLINNRREMLDLLSHADP
eukprot:c9768_g1_i1 orf=731-1909(+)